MGIGLFGKLPAKRDFIAANVAREFLTRWEEWMQASIAASKTVMGEQWLSHYLQAPLWRFHLGADVCGVPAVGVFMPSIDGVGRHFPLTAVYCGAVDAQLPALDDAEADFWFHGVEDLLLSCLDPAEEFDAVLQRFSAFDGPAVQPLPETKPDIFRAGTAYGVHVADPSEAGAAFGMIAAATAQDMARRSSFWWTIGGENFAPTALVAEGMPDPYHFNRMLSAPLAAEGAA